VSDYVVEMTETRWGWEWTLSQPPRNQRGEVRIPFTYAEGWSFRKKTATRRAMKAYRRWSHRPYRETFDPADREDQ
jgi:hypothetical protein